MKMGLLLRPVDQLVPEDVVMHKVNLIIFKCFYHTNSIDFCKINFITNKRNKISELLVSY